MLNIFKRLNKDKTIKKKTRNYKQNSNYQIQ